MKSSECHTTIRRGRLLEDWVSSAWHQLFRHVQPSQGEMPELHVLLKIGTVFVLHRCSLGMRGMEEAFTPSNINCRFYTYRTFFSMFYLICNRGFTRFVGTLPEEHFSLWPAHIPKHGMHSHIHTLMNKDPSSRTTWKTLQTQKTRYTRQQRYFSYQIGGLFLWRSGSFHVPVAGEAFRSLL